jgi:glycosyltransferase involved in cell wall biosynthesis
MNAIHPTVCGLVSVIIPVHNRLQYLAHAIGSALGQTHPRVEVIVVDDGSPKDPAPVVSRFDERVRLVRKANGGLASARNCGIRHALGEYMLFLDDDDFLEPTALVNLFAAIAAYPSAEWAAGLYDDVTPDGARIASRSGYLKRSGDVYRSMIHHNLMGAPSTVLARSRAVRTVSAFDETPCFHMAEDYDLWLKLARHSPLAVTLRKVTNYRLHGQQFTLNHPVEMTRAVLAVLRKHQALAPPGYEEDFSGTIARFEMHLGDCLYLRGDGREARSHWRTAVEGGALSARARRWRDAKSHAPFPVLQVLRGVRKSLKV